MCYMGCMHETITIRSRIPKAELQKLAGGNLNKWINGLIEQAAGGKRSSWTDFFSQSRRTVKSRADEIRKASR